MIYFVKYAKYKKKFSINITEIIWIFREIIKKKRKFCRNTKDPEKERKRKVKTRENVINEVLNRETLWETHYAARDFWSASETRLLKSKTHAREHSVYRTIQRYCMDRRTDGGTVSAMLSLLREAWRRGRKIEIEGKGSATGGYHLLLELLRRYLMRNPAVCNLSRRRPHIHTDTHIHIPEFDEFFSGVSSSTVLRLASRIAESVVYWWRTIITTEFAWQSVLEDVIFFENILTRKTKIFFFKISEIIKLKLKKNYS